MSEKGKDETSTIEAKENDPTPTGSFRGESAFLMMEQVYVERPF